MELRELGELRLIRKLMSQFSPAHPLVVKGIGDDAAVTVLDSNRYLLATTDMLVEGIHFSLTYTTPYLLGKRAVTISLSDIAAMGGTPTFLLTSIAIPTYISTEFIDIFYKGVKERCNEFDTNLIGGNTSSSERVVIGVSMLGEVKREQVVFRCGARVGDLICTTGYHGDSALGLKIWREKGGKEITDPFLKDAMLEHLDPTPRVREGRLIGERRLATAMIDVSDGLILDLRHIAEASGVGARVWLDKVPISTALKRHLLDHPEDIQLPLAGGEDYELIFTTSPDNISRIDELAKEVTIPITTIGEIVPEKEGIKVLDEKGATIPLTIEGFEHFRA